MSVVCRLIRQSGPFRRFHAFFPHDRDKNKNLGTPQQLEEPAGHKHGQIRPLNSRTRRYSPGQKFVRRNAILHSVNTLQLTGGYAPARANQQLASRPRHQTPETRWVTWFECTIADWPGHGGRKAPPPTGSLASLCVPSRHPGC
ncbi:hypothetical protein ISCGN_030442 [Ixodes scapularis]